MNELFVLAPSIYNQIRSVADPQGVQGVRSTRSPPPVFKYPMKMKYVGINETKLFHFHGITKKIVKSEIFARVLYSRNFVKIKASRNGVFIRSLSDIGKSCISRANLASQIYLLMLILAKVSEFTVNKISKANPT